MSFDEEVLGEHDECLREIHDQQDEIKRLRRALRTTRETMCPISAEHELIGPEQFAEEMAEYDSQTTRLCADSGTSKSCEEYQKLWRDYNDWREKEFEALAAEEAEET